MISRPAISDKAHYLISERLADDEKILWSGGTAKSKYPLLSASLNDLLPIGCGFLIFIVFEIGSALLSIISKEDYHISYTPLIVITLIGCILLANIYYMHRNRWFILTNRRAFLVQSAGKAMKIQEVDLAKVKCISIYTYPDGTGIIAFQQISDPWVMTRIASGEEESTGNIIGVPAFIGIENAGDVCDLLRQLIPGLKIIDTNLYLKETSNSADSKSERRAKNKRQINLIGILTIIFGRISIFIGVPLLLILPIIIYITGIHSFVAECPFSTGIQFTGNLTQVIIIIAFCAFIAGVLITVVGIFSGLHHLDIVKNWEFASALNAGHAKEIVDGSDEGKLENPYADINFYVYQVDGKEFTFKQYSNNREKTRSETITVLYNPRNHHEAIAFSDIRSIVEILPNDQVFVIGIFSRLLIPGLLVIPYIIITSIILHLFK